MTKPERECDPEGDGVPSSGRFFIGLYDSSVLLTYMGVLFAVLGICMVFRGDLVWSVVFLILAGCCDMFDGTVARACAWRTDEEKAFGIQMDSLADVTSFLILPVTIYLGIGNVDAVSIAICVFFVLTGLIRLGCFNVAASKSAVEVYTGLPVSVAAVCIPLLWLAHLYMDAFWTEVFFDIAMLLMALLFVARIRIKKPGRIAMMLMASAAAVAIVVILCLESVHSRRSVCAMRTIVGMRRISW